MVALTCLDTSCSTLDQYITPWKRLSKESQIHETQSIEEAMGIVMRMKVRERPVSVLITGSLSLVGRALCYVSLGIE